MNKIKEIHVDTLEELIKAQDVLLSENGKYTFRILEDFVNGYILEAFILNKEANFEKKL